MRLLYLCFLIAAMGCTTEEITFHPDVTPEKVQGTWINYDVPYFQNGSRVGYQEIKLDFRTHRIFNGTDSAYTAYSDELFFQVRTKIDKGSWGRRKGTTKGLWYKNLFYATEPEPRNSLVVNVAIEVVSVSSKGIRVNIGYRRHINFINIDQIKWVYTDLRLEKS